MSEFQWQVSPGERFTDNIISVYQYKRSTQEIQEVQPDAAGFLLLNEEYSVFNSSCHRGGSFSHLEDFPWLVAFTAEISLPVFLSNP